MLFLATVKFKTASVMHSWVEYVLFYTKVCHHSGLIVAVAVAQPFLVGGAWFFEWNHSKKAAVVRGVSGISSS